MAHEVTVFERQTSRGLLSVRFLIRQMRVYLDGERYLGISTVDKLPKPVLIGGVSYTHAIGGRFALTSSEAEAISAVKMAASQTLEGRREILAEAVLLSDPGAFPGSVAHRRASAALSELAAFDREHPEILKAAIEQKKESVGYVD